MTYIIDNSITDFKELPFDEHYNSTYSVINDTHFILRKIDKKTLYIQFPYEKVDKSIGKEIEGKWKELMQEKDRKERAKLKRFIQTKNGYSAQLCGNKHSLTEENISLAAKLIEETLREHDQEIMNICVKCNVVTQQLTYNKGNIEALCESCMDEIMDDHSKDTQAYQYITGTIGAILGGIVGCIPYILLAFILNTLLGVLAFLFGLASMKGYELFKGPRKRWFANLIVIPITVLITFFVSLFFSFGDLSNAIFTFIFGISGIFYVLSESKRFVYSDTPIVLANADLNKLNI